MTASSWSSQKPHLQMGTSRLSIEQDQNPGPGQAGLACPTPPTTTEPSRISHKELRQTRGGMESRGTQGHLRCTARPLCRRTVNVWPARVQLLPEPWLLGHGTFTEHLLHAGFWGHQLRPSDIVTRAAFINAAEGRGVSRGPDQPGDQGDSEACCGPTWAVPWGRTFQAKGTARAEPRGGHKFRVLKGQMREMGGFLDQAGVRE